MGPKRYLTMAAIAVLLSWVAVLGLVYSGTDKLRTQRETYDGLTQQSLTLEQMRGAILQMAAASDEYLMLGAINRFEHSMPPEQLQKDFKNKHLQSRNQFAKSFLRFQSLLSMKNWTDPDSARNAPPSDYAFMQMMRDKYYSYIVASDKLQKLSGSHVYLSYIARLKGEQRSIEAFLLHEIEGRIEAVQQQLGSENPHFESTITDSRNIVLSLMLVAIIPAFLTGYLAYRGIVLMFNEINAQREDKLRSNASLEAALAELRRLQDTLVQSERLSTLGKLTATVSHELRNPMAAIRNSLFLIREFASDKDKVIGNVERAERSIARCDNIIGDLLEYTRQRNLNLKPTPLSEWVRETLAEQKFPVEVQVKLDLRSGEAKVSLDDDRFRRVLINLVQNSSEAIKVSKGHGEVAIHTGVIGDSAYIDIVDDGPGIPEDVIPRIFEPLFTTKSFGAGLGLPTAKRLVEQHSGKMTVNSKVGFGTSFRVVLPISTSTQEQAA